MKSFQIGKLNEAQKRAQRIVEKENQNRMERNPDPAQVILKGDIKSLNYQLIPLIEKGWSPKFLYQAGGPGDYFSTVLEKQRNKRYEKTHIFYSDDPQRHAEKTGDVILAYCFDYNRRAPLFCFGTPEKRTEPLK